MERKITQNEQNNMDLRGKRILICTNHSFMLYQFRLELIQELRRENEVYISVPFSEHIDDFNAMGCHMIDTALDRRGINPVSDFGLMKHYLEILKKVRPDFVITYSIKPNIYCGFLCRMKGIPYFVNVQGLGTAFQSKKLAFVVTNMYRIALKKAGRVFFENTANAKEFTNRRIIPQQKITVLNGAGVNLRKYCYQFYHETDSIRFLYLGRLMKEKGVEELFYAAKKLKAKYGNKVHFDLVGFYEDGYKEIVEQLIQEGIVEFHGFQQDPRPFYSMCNCVVLPSYHEGMSNVLLEAAAMGRAVITSDIPGCRETVIDGKSGFLCKARAQEDLYEKMEKFVGLNSEERKEMGFAGRKLMESLFDKDKVVRETTTVIKNNA